MWQALSAIAVPLLGILAALFSRQPASRLSKRLLHHLDVREHLADNSRALATMDDLITEEVAELARQERARVNRKLNKANLVLAIILALLTGVAVYYLWTWIIATAGSAFLWLAIVVTVVAGLILLLVTAAGFATVYNPPAPSKSK